ncbi:hypothetical protein [Ochrovirga pacifica]|uniref:hypothetical protein n=1 Tax=Ochrovirga pacifica TaxID=1042376 RepID=UPI0002557FFF|nr:hypothetical protein [Ochrovirga pacifica]
MKKVIYFSVVTLVFFLTSCLSGSGYRRIGKLKLVNFKNPDTIAIKIENENLFQLRIFEETVHFVDDGVYTNTEYLNYTQALSFQDTISYNKRQVVEETYLYLDGLNESKNGGYAIYIETHPIIKNKYNLDSYREKYFNNPNKIYTNILKTCFVGKWEKEQSNNQYLITFQTYKSIMFKKQKGKKVFKIKANYIQDSIPNKAVISIHSISHPAIFKNDIDESVINSAEFLKIDSILSLEKMSNNNLEPGLLFFNVPKNKKITIAHEDEMIFHNYDLNKTIKYFIIKDNNLFFSNDTETYLHLNSQVYK